MKKLLQYGLAQAVSSIMPILMWMLLSVVYHNKDYSNVFTLTYSFQFIFSIIYSSTVYGSLVYESNNKLGDRNYSWSATINGVILLGIAAIYQVVNYKARFNSLGVEVGSYLPLYVYSLLAFVPNMLIASIVAVMQFNGEEKRGCRLMTIYYVIQCGSIVLMGLITQDVVLSSIVSLSIATILSIVALIKNIKLSKYEINSFKGVKYRIVSLCSSICMYLIYTYGLKSITELSALVLATYNIMAICTDTQWDVLGTSIETNTTIKVCSGEYDKDRLKVILQSVLMSLITLSTTVVMAFISSLYYDIDVEYLVKLLVLEVGLFPLYSLRYVLTEYLNIRHPSILMPIVHIIAYTLRTILSVLLVGQYGLSISLCVVSGIGLNVVVVVIYIAYRKIEERSTGNIKVNSQLELS